MPPTFGQRKILAGPLWLLAGLLLSFPASAAPFLDWASLKNPILSVPDRMLKDQSVLYRDGWFYVFASTRFEDTNDAGPGCFFRSRDLREWERFADPDVGVTFGALTRFPGSPDVSFADGRYRMVFQAGPDDYFRRLYFSSSDDLVDWEAAREINPGMRPDQRQIDGALAFEAGHYILGYKGGQDFYVTRSLGPALDGRWEDPVRASAGGAWAENFQFIKLDGAWRMVATGYARPGRRVGFSSYAGNHDPYLYRMDGRGDHLADWTRWVDRTPLDIPAEDWNQKMRANSAFLCDWRQHDGYFYLFYAGANDDKSFHGRGHGQIGVARSRDLRQWRTAGNP